jgi:hypothetical protein
MTRIAKLNVATFVIVVATLTILGLLVWIAIIPLVQGP